MEETKGMQETFAIVNGKNRNCQTCKNSSGDFNDVVKGLVCSLDGIRVSEKLVCPEY